MSCLKTGSEPLQGWENINYEESEIKSQNVKGVLTCERMIPLVVFVNSFLVLCKYLQSVVVLLHVVGLVVLQEEEQYITVTAGGHSCCDFSPHRT